MHIKGVCELLKLHGSQIVYYYSPSQNLVSTLYLVSLLSEVKNKCRNKQDKHFLKLFFFSLSNRNTNVQYTVMHIALQTRQ